MNFNSGAPIALIAYGVKNAERLIGANLGFVSILNTTSTRAKKS